MKIMVINVEKQKPVKKTKIQLSIRGKDSGYLTLTTDDKGFVELNNKYKNQQITYVSGNSHGQWIAATDGAKLYVADLSTTPHEETS